MKKFIFGLIGLLGVGSLVSGCSLLNPISAMNQIPADQVGAYQSAGFDVAQCFTIGGPPIAGNAIFMVFPKGSQLPVFGDGCHIVTQAPSLIQQLPAGSTLTIKR